MKKAKPARVFQIDPGAIANPVMRVGIGLTRGIIEKSLRFPVLNSIYQQTQDQRDGSISFARRALRAMNVTWQVHGSEECPIPADGPVMVVANHPYGGIEGILLLALLEPFRPDVKVMANYLLARMPETRSSFIFVDPFGSARSARANIRPLKEALGWLKQGHLLGIFPAGEVSSVDLKSGKVRDPAWSPSVAAMVRRTQASVVPVFFAGHNGPLFNLAGLLHPRLRTLMLPQQLVNKRNHEIRVQIGQAIPWSEMSEYATDEQLIQYLRLRTYILAERESAAARRSPLPFRRRRARQQPIAPAGSSASHAREIAALPPAQLLTSSGDLRVYVADARQIPEVLRDLGRLREITFRAVGEGTGKAIDLDRFDDYYLHLFLWNAARNEVAGAYRLGLADEIVAARGVKGLYTHTCFRFDERLMRRLQPAIELGRSFVRPEYQKAFNSLLLLWRGLSVFVLRHPRYTHLFGPVSITNEYRDASRNLMLRSLRFSNFEHELARFVKPRKRPRRTRHAEWNLPDFHPYIDNIELVSKLVQEIESDQKGIPILLRQYLKLGGRLLAFNVDPDFSYSLDGLIAVNLLKTDPRVLRRYMGVAETDSYRAYHGLKPLEDS
ncbi:MAG: GNAT family N-acetyltransferase [Kiritimatiellae bacterium]|nr:GNAT family N-acetyltransferase [Kiritimatiellia bacterium]